MADWKNTDNSRNPTHGIQLAENTNRKTTHGIQLTESNSRNSTHGNQHAEFNSRNSTHTYFFSDIYIRKFKTISVKYFTKKYESNKSVEIWPWNLGVRKLTQLRIRNISTSQQVRTFFGCIFEFSEQSKTVIVQYTESFKLVNKNLRGTKALRPQGGSEVLKSC